MYDYPLVNSTIDAILQTSFLLGIQTISQATSRNSPQGGRQMRMTWMDIHSRHIRLRPRWPSLHRLESGRLSLQRGNSLNDKRKPGSLCEEGQLLGIPRVELVVQRSCKDNTDEIGCHEDCSDVCCMRQRTMTRAHIMTWTYNQGQQAPNQQAKWVAGSLSPKHQLRHRHYDTIGTVQRQPTP